MLKLTLISAASVLLTVTPAIAQQRYIGKTNNGVELYLHLSPQPRNLGKGVVAFTYSVKDKTGLRTRQAITASCDQEGGVIYEIDPSVFGWYANVNGKYIFIKVESEASAQLIGAVCRLAFD